MRGAITCLVARYDSCGHFAMLCSLPGDLGSDTSHHLGRSSERETPSGADTASGTSHRARLSMEQTISWRVRIGPWCGGASADLQMRDLESRQGIS